MYELLLASIDLKWYHYLIAVGVILIICYLILLVISFCFMQSFKRKIKKQNEKLSIILFQKKECISQLIYSIKDKVSEQIYNEISMYYQNEKYQLFVGSELMEENSKVLLVNKKINGIYVNYLKGDDKSIKDSLGVLSDLDNYFMEVVQLYNSYVIGYNYWRNLFSTKWVKKLLHIKLLDTLN